MKREKLLRSKDYIVSQIQLNLLNLIENYKKSKNLKDYELAKELNVSKGYVSQLLNATFDHKISKVVDLALACNTMPLIYFVDIEDFIKRDAEDKIYGLMPMIRPREMTYEAYDAVIEPTQKTIKNPIEYNYSTKQELANG